MPGFKKGKERLTACRVKFMVGLALPATAMPLPPLLHGKAKLSAWPCD
jgi:hypothetical protein